MFCVKCGKEEKTYDSLCATCYLQRNRFTNLDEQLELQQCAHCDDYLMDKKWVHYEDELDAVYDHVTANLLVREDALVRDLDLEVQEIDRKSYRVLVYVTVAYEDLEVIEESETIVRIKRESCPKCNKIHGNYYESIVQVRPTGKRFSDNEREELLQRAMSHIENASRDSRDAFMAKAVEAHSGYDFYISTIALGKTLARDLVSTYGADYKESASLHGRKDGVDIYRVTYLVRLPPYRVRDIIELNDKLYLIRSTGPQMARLRELKHGDNLSISNDRLRNVNVIGTKDDVVEAVVLGEEKRELQLMHPRSFATIEIRKPQGFEREGDAVKVFLYNDEIYIIGN
ncbi:MAG: hypothetical protein GX369_07410 [Euryarchaeota archaeon]|nr:hypothetical protein [Euryarchaeota archaeon]